MGFREGFRSLGVFRVYGCGVEGLRVLGILAFQETAPRWLVPWV